LSENELVMTRDELDALKDQIYILHCALNDVLTDLASPRQTKETLQEMLKWLIQAAEPIAAVSLTPAIRS
jgi:PleD family two-component response regulator